MAAYPSNKNIFLDDDDDIDDEAFLNTNRNYMLSNNLSSNGFSSNNIPSTMEEKRQEMLQKKREVEQRTIKSTERSLSYLRNSEEVGVATAEELYRQREKLERTEKCLDDINTTLRFSQRHIQGIKSVFGGLKNLISGKSGTLPPVTKNVNANETSTTPSSSNLYEVIDRKKNETAPGLKIRGLYDNDESTVLESKAQDVIDKNLDQMLSSIHRLKDLGYNLGEEITSQNVLIEKVIDKSEQADCSLKKQSKDINKMLK